MVSFSRPKKEIPDKRRDLHEKTMVCSVAFEQLPPGAKRSQQPEPGQLEGFQRTGHHTRLRQQIQRRLHTEPAGTGQDLRTSSYGQNKTWPVLGTTGGSDRDEITFAEHKLR